MANFTRNFLAGMDMGRERRLQDEAIAKQNQLARLAGDAFAMPESRAAILPEIARLDPGAAFEMQGAFDRQSQQAQQAEQAKISNMAKLLASAPVQARPGLYARARPLFQQAAGVDLPEAWTDDLLPLAQSLGGVDQGAQSAQRAYVEWMAQQIPEAERGEFFRVQAGLAPKAQNQQFTIKEIENADGTKSFVPVATRGGNVAGAPALAPPAAGPAGRSGTPNMDAILAQANAMARQGIPDVQIEQFIASAAQRQGVSITPAQMDANASATLDAQTYGTTPASLPAPVAGGAAGGQATNETRAAAAAAAAAAKVRAEEQARAGVQREIDAPKTIEEGERLIGYIDAIINDPNRELVTGGSGVFDPRTWPGIDRISGAADTKLRVAQVQGNAFLQAFQSLKGGGAITEVEGQKAEQAIARLSTAQSDEGFLAALKDFREAIAPGIERARARAAGEQPQPAPMAAQAQTGSPAQSRPRAQSADGRVVEWNGTAWVGVR